MVISLTAIT